MRRSGRRCSAPLRCGWSCTRGRWTWPGNVRELRNVIEHAMIISAGKSLQVHLPAISSEESVASPPLEDVQRKHILGVREKAWWCLTGKGRRRAARPQAHHAAIADEEARH